MNRTGIVRDARYMNHQMGDYHPESPERLRAIYARLDEPGMAGKFVEIPVRMAQREEIRKVLPSLSSYSWKLYAQSNLFDILRIQTVENPVAQNTGMRDGALVMGIKLLPDRVLMEGRFLTATPTITP